MNKRVWLSSLAFLFLHCSSVSAQPEVEVDPWNPIGIEGIAQEGLDLYCWGATYLRGPLEAEESYSWLRKTPDGSTSLIEGANEQFYMPSTDDIGSNIACRQTLTYPGGTAVETSKFVGPVSAKNPQSESAPANLLKPSIAGAPRLGPSDLRCFSGVWSHLGDEDMLEIEWIVWDDLQQPGRSVGPASGGYPFLLLGKKSVGKYYGCRASVRNFFDDQVAASADSAPVGPIQPALSLRLLQPELQCTAANCILTALLSTNDPQMEITDAEIWLFSYGRKKGGRIQDVAALWSKPSADGFVAFDLPKLQKTRHQLLLSGVTTTKEFVQARIHNVFKSRRGNWTIRKVRKIRY